MDTEMSGSDVTNGHGFTPNVKKTSAKKVSKIIEEEDPYEKIEVNKDTFKVKAESDAKSSQIVKSKEEVSVENVDSKISHKTEQKLTQNSSVEVKELEIQKNNKIENLQ